MDYLCAVNESLAFGGNSSSIKQTDAEQAESSNEELQVVIQPHKSVSVGCPTAGAEVKFNYHIVFLFNQQVSQLVPKFKSAVFKTVNDTSKKDDMQASLFLEMEKLYRNRHFS